uniref:Uncharacterized protein n=1 Tax=Candidatus Kentrum eta TaxID=2126337 RepID=A0A450UCJ3_9GAMM|nr:MAG: hypothetical protein BECKH772A_GA0070896_1001917 [Candidatus Kentron sp. H]VFJ91402.1 MAG: hypothetical protein BECKH772B_GA0070898_1001717 [Candidatus Kentron sp. H]VFJ98093.1 MAG: hypothetical protein BECKH772C_GA0070978_1001817 [Candidatus Kentron sp. H]
MAYLSIIPIDIMAWLAVPMRFPTHFSVNPMGKTKNRTGNFMK